MIYEINSYTMRFNAILVGYNRVASQYLVTQQVYHYVRLPVTHLGITPAYSNTLSYQFN